MYDILETILTEIRSKKSMSTTTNLRSEVAEAQNTNPSGSKSIGRQASNFENSDSENENYPLKTSGSKDPRHPAKPLYRNEIDLDETMISNEDSEEEDYHMVTGANQQLQTQSSQNPQSLNDATGSHANHSTSNLTAKSLDPVNQIALAIEKLANKKATFSFSSEKHTNIQRKE